MIRGYFVSAIALLALVASTGFVYSAKSSFSIVDRGDPLIEGFSETLCFHEDGVQLSRISSLAFLKVDLALLKGSLNAKCSILYQEPLRDLKKVIWIGKIDGICGQNQATQIEYFHRKYILATILNSKENAPGDDIHIPGPLRMFFMHYAMTVSDICKENIVRNLKLVTRRANMLYDEFSDQNLSRSIGVMHKYLVSSAPLKDYDDFLLIWSAFDDYKQENGNHKKDKPSIFEIKEAATIKNLQSKCLNELKPIYSISVLPLMRIIQLGYFHKRHSHHFHFHHRKLELPRDELKLLQTWYRITQVCETILPVKLYENKSIDSSQALLITSEEAQELALPYELPVGVIKAITVPTIGIDNVLESVYKVEPDKLVKLIKANRKERSQVSKKIIKHVVIEAKRRLKSRIKRFFVSRKKVTKNGTEFVKESGDKLIDESLTNVDMMLEQEETETARDMEKKRAGLFKRIKAHVARNDAYAGLGFVLFLVFILSIIALG